MFLGCTKELAGILQSIEQLKLALKERTFDLSLFKEVMSFAEAEGLYLALISKSGYEIKSELAVSFNEVTKQQLLAHFITQKTTNISVLKHFCKCQNPQADVSLYNLDNPDSGFLSLISFNNKRSNRTAPASYLIELILPYIHKAHVARFRAESSDLCPLSTLTCREKEVFDWIASGKTNVEIGLILGISPFTVKNHVAKILEKLNAPNRSAAMALRKNSYAL